MTVGCFVVLPVLVILFMTLAVLQLISAMQIGPVPQVDNAFQKRTIHPHFKMKTEIRMQKYIKK